MKKLLLIISTMYLTGCSVAKPVVLSAPIQQINSAYDSNNTRNGATDMEIVKRGYYEIASQIDENVSLLCTTEIYITPYNNPSYFDFRDDNRSTRVEGNYRSFDTNIFFQTKASCKIDVRNRSDIIYRWENSETMQINTSQASKNTRAFKMYKLPYNIATQVNMSNSAIMQTYVYQNTLETKKDISGNFIVNPYTYTYRIYRNEIRGGQIYYYDSGLYNVADFIPPLEDPNANRLGLYYYNDIETIGAMTIQWPQIINNDDILSDYTTELNNIFTSFFECNENINGRLTYQYNASLSDELTAYQTGYNQGLEEGAEGVGVGWVRQVFRAIQAFLDFDFGFFKLGHLLGGILVIAVVIFVVRWFR